MIRRAPWLLVPLLLLVVGCTATDRGEAAPPSGAGSPFAECAALTAPPSAATPTPDGGAPAAGPAQPLPAVELPCFTGGRPIAVDAIRGPAVINLWASWCPPCRKELPAFQRLAERSAGRVHVIGVDTRDGREDAQSLGQEFGLTFPTLYDPGEKLRVALARTGLPITLFVDGQGRLRHVDNSGALDDAALAGLVARHLGVAVAP